MPDDSVLFDFLRQEALGITLQQWLTALATACGIGVALCITKGLLARHARILASRYSNDWYDTVGNLVRQTPLWFLLVLSLYGGSLVLDLPARYVDVPKLAATIAMLIQAALWGDVLVKCRLVRHAARRVETDAGTATTLMALAFVVRVAIWTIMILLVLSNLGVDVTAMVAGLGIGGVAIALAAQNILGDLFASASIVLDKPFVLGDFIVVGQDMGTVEHVGLKTTRVRSLSGEQLVFGNNDLLKSRIRNFKRMNERRVLFSIGVAYETAAEKVAAIPLMLREAVEGQSATRFDRAHFQSYGDSALIFEIVYYVASADYNLSMDIQQAINLAILRRFTQENISFAYPTHTIYLNDGRSRQEGHC